MAKPYQLGELLIKADLITPEQLHKALEEQKMTGGYLGEILVKKGYAIQNEISKVLASQLNLPYVEISSYKLNSELINIFPEEFIRRLKILPLELKGNELTVAMGDPMNLFAIQEMRYFSGYTIIPVLATKKEIMESINHHLGSKYNAARAIEEITVKEEREPAKVSLEQLETAIEEPPVVRLVSSIIAGGIRRKASDIHIEPQKDNLRVRYRIDGVLYKEMSIPKKLQPTVISRIKIISGMDIAERRQPQDGRIKLGAGGKNFDLRVSTLPTMYGEKVVIRILDKESILVGLEKLGMDDKQFATFNSFISRSYGIILVTGPTGCGKTTTLYSALTKLNTLARNVITVEDPIEYELEGVNQVPVNPKAGITFARGMRHILRQDPDVIMIGEIRDLETAEIAIQAALTGHLVLSTLHTNDAPSAIIRLIDMKVKPFLISSSVIGVVAQRLARVLCPQCKQEYETSPEALKSSEGLVLPDTKKITLARNVGCKECDSIGYRHRTGIFEIMTMTDHIRELILAEKSSGEITKVAIEEGMTTLQESGFKKALDKITSLEEVMRVAFIAES